ncbi:MAG: TonB-dependent receptor [Gammaproteobacteria bacterium]|nr:MAG: TonB-dependent receptor [Gammaproteobacteria bacterium]TLZ18850.1 MAG: TonB-dependent receptor [Gammaproteobacteria bacterium]
MRRLVSVLAVACGLVVIYEPVWAQTQTLEEVVVTARRRDEAIQNVPVTVNVFTEQAIESAGIESPRDFVAMVPNMTLVEVQNVGNSFITIRGISQARNSEPSVAVLVDGVLETNPYQFDQELTDIREIEVLKGPQGAVYGRNAIGGAILIHTVDPSDHFSGAARVGVGNGTSENAQVAVSGPIDSAGTLKVRASLNYYNTDGYRQNAFLDRKADPYRDYSGRLRLLWKPSEQWSADLRALFDRVETTAFYYIIPRNLEANPFASFTTPPNANDVTSAIQNSNLGTDNRDVADVALKFDFNLGPGTLTAVSDYNRTKEIDTGDAYDFRPITTSIAYNCPPCFLGPRPPPTAAQGGPFDLSQSQFIDVTTYSQELRFTSSKIGGFSWIAGAYYVHTERFISTDNLFDRGAGIPAVYETPRVDPANPYATNTNITFLSDSQNNNAWAVFGDGTYEFTKQLELDAAIRYDEDQRQNTTRTPTQFLPDSTAKTGEVRKHTFDAAQPKGTLRYKPTDNLTLYGGWSRGFRSGGFNQTGVGAVAQASGNLGVHDLFNAEIAETWEVGLKSQFLDRRLGANLALYYTDSHDGYFFYFDATTSTQNLGNLDARYKGGELELTARATDWLDLYTNFGYTDGKVTHMEDPTVVGNKPPLLTKNTVNAGFQVHEPLGGGLNGVLRLDYQMIGRTWWDPKNLTSRDPIDLLGLRAGVEADRWSVTAWSKNLTNKLYNAEFSPGGFLWRAMPRQYGVEFGYRF